MLLSNSDVRNGALPPSPNVVPNLNAPQGHVTNPRGTGIALIPPTAAAGIGYRCSTARATNSSCAHPHSSSISPIPSGLTVSLSFSSSDGQKARFLCGNAPVS
ncbi:hypothetical protein NQZ68_036522 [Dissostichus eleginoides]|nr:hypothetical protein NQZ68_036522 [Dissostichus eleginoides]